MVVEPRLSSAVMLLRDSAEHRGIEVFMVRRVVQSEFMPGVYVFPGGSVSADDRVAEQSEGICAPVVSPSAADSQVRAAIGTGVRVAAIRELFEEGNVLLAYRDGEILALNEETAPHFTGYRKAFHERKGSMVALVHAERLTLATDRLYYFAHWITPEGMPKRFDTHFFLAAAPAEQEALYDELETSDGTWLHPADALEGFNRGEIPIVFATYYQLRDLATFNSVQEALAATATRSVSTCRPVREQREDGVYVYLPEDSTNAWKL